MDGNGDWTPDPKLEMFVFAWSASIVAVAVVIGFVFAMI